MSINIEAMRNGICENDGCDRAAIMLYGFAWVCQPCRDAQVRLYEWVKR